MLDLVWNFDELTKFRNRFEERNVTPFSCSVRSFELSDFKGLHSVDDRNFLSESVNNLILPTHCCIAKPVFASKVRIIFFY